MQPQSLPFGSWGGFGLNQSTSNPQYGGVFGCRTESFDFKDLNFKELSMNRASNDYFALKPVLASSPTASLAADLSQNFHIDRR